MPGDRDPIHIVRSPAVWITLVLAVAVVAVAVPLRSQRAERTDTEAWVPMRNLTPQEAAALLETGDRLARIGDGTVDLVTDRYLVPVRSPEGDAHLIRRGGRTWHPVVASMSGFALRYRLDRAPLEQELGGRPLAGFLDRKARARRLSFSSERLPLYAAFEVAILWATLLLLWLIVRAVRPRTLVAPALLLLAFGFLRMVSWYAPAWYDADFFYQRWVVESIALWVYLFGGLLVWASGLSLLGLLAVGLVRLLRRGVRLSRAQRIAISWAPAVLLLLAGLTAHWVTVAKERRDLDAMAGALHFDAVGAVLDEARALHRKAGNGASLRAGDLPPHLRRFVADAFAGMPKVPAGGAIVLVPVEGEDYLFLWRRPEFTYMDFRPLVSQSGQEGIDAMLATKRPVATGFFAQLPELALRGVIERLNGRPLLGPDGRVKALLYVERMVFLGWS